MRLGTLGSGLMGGKLGTIFARAGHDGWAPSAWSGSINSSTSVVSSDSPSPC